LLEPQEATTCRPRCLSNAHDETALEATRAARQLYLDTPHVHFKRNRATDEGVVLPRLEEGNALHLEEA
jgi:hypothetical protein